jgi:PAS domain S-box-containing protein
MPALTFALLVLLVLLAAAGGLWAWRRMRRLEERAARFEGVAHAFDRMGDAMVITSASGRVLAVNQSFASVTGISSEEAIGRHEKDLNPAMQPDALLEIYAAVLRNGHWHGTVWCRRRDGSLGEEWRHITVVRDADGRVTHFLTLFRGLEGQEAGRKMPVRGWREGS